MQATQRHLPRLAARRVGARRRGARLLRASAEGLEGLGGDRADDPDGHGRLRPAVRLDARARARPQRRPDRDRRLPRQGRHASTARSSSSRTPTPSRTSATTRRWPTAVKSGRITAERASEALARRAADWPRRMHRRVAVPAQPGRGLARRAQPIERAGAGGVGEWTPRRHPRRTGRAADRDERAGDRTEHIHPVAAEVPAHERRAEGAGGVHRGAAHGRRPQAGERDVTADAERRDRADVLGGRGGSQDDAHQRRGEDDLHQQRLPVRIARARQRGAEVLDVAEHRVEKQARQRGADQLDDDVAGDDASTGSLRAGRTRATRRDSGARRRPRP